MHDGKSLDCEHYVSDVFDTNTGMLWHYDNDNITQISYLPEGVILERFTKKTRKESGVRIKKMVVYILTSHLINPAVFFKNPPTCPKSII